MVETLNGQSDVIGLWPVAEFVEERLELFGPYEDAMTTRSRTVFHSALSPLSTWD